MLSFRPAATFVATKFHLNRVLSQTARSQFKKLPLYILFADNEEVENQYRRLLMHVWTKKSGFATESITNEGV